MSGGGESQYNASYVDGVDKQANANIQVAIQQAKSDKYAADKQSWAVVEQAKYDYQARIKEAELANQAENHALEVRTLEAKLTHKEEMTRIREVDAPRVQNEAIVAESKLVKAQASRDREERRSKKDEMQFAASQAGGGLGGGNGGGYWYGMS